MFGDGVECIAPLILLGQGETEARDRSAAPGSTVVRADRPGVGNDPVDLVPAGPAPRGTSNMAGCRIGIGDAAPFGHFGGQLTSPATKIEDRVAIPGKTNAMVEIGAEDLDSRYVVELNEIRIIVDQIRPCCRL